MNSVLTRRVEYIKARDDKYVEMFRAACSILDSKRTSRKYVIIATVSSNLYDTSLEASLSFVNWHLHAGHDENKFAGLFASRDVAWSHLGGSVNSQNKVQKIPC
jgi:hypothetical protein